MFYLSAKKHVMLSLDRQKFDDGYPDSKEAAKTW